MNQNLVLGLLLALEVGTLSAQSTPSTVFDRVILGGRAADPASRLDAARKGR